MVLLVLLRGDEGEWCGGGWMMMMLMTVVVLEQAARYL